MTTKTSWQTKKLGEISDFEGGSQPPKSNFIHEPRKGYVRFLQIRDFGSDKYITYIPDSKKNRHCNEDDILLGRYGASVGKILVNKKGAYNVAVMKTMPNPQMVDKSYFYYYLISDEFQKPLSKVAARSAQAGFSKDDIYDFPVLTPPISEQKKVVKKLDEVFEKVTRAKEAVEKNLQNAKELFESYLQGVFANPGKDWQEKRLDEICKIQTGKWDANHATKNGKYRFYTCAYAYGFCDTKRFSGECLILPGNGVNVGEVFYYSGDFDAYQRTYVISEIEITPLFLYYHMKSFWRSRNINKQYGSATNFLKIGNFHNYLVVFPKLISEQKFLVKKLDLLSVETKRLEKIYEQKLADLEELKKSVLKKAFCGKL